EKLCRVSECMLIVCDYIEVCLVFCFFFQAEDGIRDYKVTGVQTCALPISDLHVRFLQLAAEDNMQICQPSTAAQYFHMLRRQARRPWRKPLIVFTPKSMLRHPDASSVIDEFSTPRFLPLVPDREIRGASRILIASGKVGHELRAERRRRKDPSTAIFF